MNGAAAPNPANLSQLDRPAVPFAPKSPEGDFAPPVPPRGSGGNSDASKMHRVSKNLGCANDAYQKPLANWMISMSLQNKPIKSPPP